MKAKDILAEKGTRVETIAPATTVIDAMLVFSTKKIGSLLVVDHNDRIVGIVAARDVLMAVIHHPDTIKTITVDEVMTKNVIVATEDDSVDYIQAVMTENRIRHVPIVKEGTLKGLISIGDVVKSLLTEKDVENKYLKDYIADKYPG